MLDCDSTLRTDVGSLATIGQSQTENLVHFVFDDATNPSTGGIPIRGMEQVDLIAMADGAGYAKSYEFERLEELLIGMEEVMEQTGPVFVLVKVIRDDELPPFPERSMAGGMGLGPRHLDDAWSAIEGTTRLLPPGRTSIWRATL